MLTPAERSNLQAAWEKLDKTGLEKELHCAVPGQTPKYMKITCGNRCLPTFTTADFIFKRDIARWMTGHEKLAALGFPVGEAIAAAYGTVTG